MSLALAATLSASFAPRAPAAVANEWIEFKAKFSKSYASEAEEEKRFGTYLASVQEVAEINSRPNSTWTAALNEFSDMSWAEFQAARLMTPQNCSATHKASGWKKAAEPPAEIDWRSKITGWTVKNQGNCGSCWTFSTAGSMEAHHFLKYGELKNLSEQQLVDCAGDFNNFGCNGGLPSQAFEYLKYNGGQDSEGVYPYTAKTGKKCKYDGKPAAKVASVVNISAQDESGLIAAVGTEGPVSIAFEVASDFRFYKSGVYNGTCSTAPSKVNHAVVAVGYGTTHKTSYAIPYFTVRNSWGSSWGMDGYFNIIKGYNKCGLADCASFPKPA